MDPNIRALSGSRNGCAGVPATTGRNSSLDAVESSRQACETTEAAERQSLAAQQAAPQYSIVYAATVEIPPPSNYGFWRLIGTTLVAGLLMACGIGFVGVAAAIEPLSGSVAQVQADARVPVVGVIPADDPAPNAAVLSRHKTRVRRTLIALGLLMMAACPAAAVWGVLGI